MNEIDNISLQFFTNKTQYDLLIKRNNVSINTEFTNDKKFYKKRILDLTKRGFKNEIEDNHVNETFNRYIKACIDYLKFNDKKEIYQEQYGDIDEDLTSDNNNEENVNENDSKLNVLDTIHETEYENCNELMYKKDDIKKLNLDTYVKVKRVNKKTKILPKKSEINIKSKEYKTKGIIKKKKNLTNIYEDSIKT